MPASSRARQHRSSRPSIAPAIGGLLYLPVEYHNKHRSFNISEPRINERIRVPEVRLVGPAGEQVGIVRIEDALRLAAESDLDLVEVAPQAKPPVCKLMDFGKYKYEAAVKAREARKNQTNTVLKEIRFRLKIDTHDYETKRGHALRFLGAGDKVKAMIQFRGREQQRPEMGIRLLQRFADDVAEVGVVESSPRIDGRNMVMVVGPLKNKAEAKAEARRATQRAEAKAQNEAKARGPRRHFRRRPGTPDAVAGGPAARGLHRLRTEAPKLRPATRSSAAAVGGPGRRGRGRRLQAAEAPAAEAPKAGGSQARRLRSRKLRSRKPPRQRRLPKQAAPKAAAPAPKPAAKAAAAKAPQAAKAPEAEQAAPAAAPKRFLLRRSRWPGPLRRSPLHGRCPQGSAEAGRQEDHLVHSCRRPSSGSTATSTPPAGAAAR